MRLRAAYACVTLVGGACAGPGARPPDVQLTVAPPPPYIAASVGPIPPPAAGCADGQMADPTTHACITACGAQPAYARPAIDPTCTDVTLRDGHAYHDQLTLQLSSGAMTRIDCPRMRFRAQDTPACIARIVGGRMRGACCPPGHTDPTDPECVGEGSVDEMFKRQKVWEWCTKGEPLPRPCEPCVWVSGARR